MHCPIKYIDTPCMTNYDNSPEKSSHSNPHLLTGVPLV